MCRGGGARRPSLRGRSAGVPADSTCRGRRLHAERALKKSRNFSRIFGQGDAKLKACQSRTISQRPTPTDGPTAKRLPWKLLRVFTEWRGMRADFQASSIRLDLYPSPPVTPAPRASTVRKPGWSKLREDQVIYRGDNWLIQFCFSKVELCGTIRMERASLALWGIESYGPHRSRA